MKRIKILIIFLIIAALSACQVFLGSDSDTSRKEILYSLWKDFDEIHAYIDIRMSHNQNFNSWKEVYDVYSSKISAGTDDRELFEICKDMLRELNDPHVGLYSPDAYSSGENEGVRKGVNREKISGYLDDGGKTSNDKDKFFLYGRFISKPQVGYIHIASFMDNDSNPDSPQKWVKAIDGIVVSLADTDAIIVDIRGNGGGLSVNADYIAARFASVQKNYSKLSMKNGPGRGDFSTPIIGTIKPAGKRYTKTIVLLTNKESVSAAEWFTLALRTQSHVKHMGTITCGAFSPKVERPMINGWYYSISPGRVTDMAGNCYEGIGLTPEKEVTDEGEGSWSRPDPDKQLEGVLACLNP